MSWLIGIFLDLLRHNLKLIENYDISGLPKPTLSSIYDDGCSESIGSEERICNPNDTGFPKVMIIVNRLFISIVLHTP